MIALNMIVGPFEEPFIGPSIESAMALCDEFVFVDTSPGSNPSRTILEEMKSSFNAKIIDLPRGEDKDFSFSKARELARKNTESEWILRLDADEVLHENTIQRLKQIVMSANVSAVEVSFYHFMIYPWLYQYIEPKRILYRKDKGSWEQGVHEQLKISGPVLYEHKIKYFHYGYCRGQEEVFKRWQLYVDIDGKPDWYKGVDSKSILDDRLSVCQNFRGEHPKYIKGLLTEMFKDVSPFSLKQSQGKHK